MYGFFIVVHVFISVGLMLSVLMQSAKGEGLAGAFGGSSLTGTVFGGRGAAPFLAKATSGLAIAFFLSCILLTFLSPATNVSTINDGTNVESAVQKAAQERQGEIPIQPATTTPGTIPAGGQPGAQQQPAKLPGTAPATDHQHEQQQQQQPAGQTKEHEGH